MNDRVKDGSVAGTLFWCAVVAGIAVAGVAGAIDLAAWVPIPRPSPSPSTLQQVDAMRTSFREGRWAEALTAARAVRARLPDDPEAQRVEAASLLQSGRLPEARDALRRIAERAPGDLDLRIRLALLEAQTGRLEEARATLRTVRRHPAATERQREEALGALIRLDLTNPEMLPPVAPDAEGRRGTNPAPPQRSAPSGG